MKSSEKVIMGVIAIVIFLLTILLISAKITRNRNENEARKVVISEVLNTNNTLYKTYGKDDFDEFYSDYLSENLPEIYVTEFLFDGISTYKPCDIEDYEADINFEPKALNKKIININTSRNIELSGDIKGGMIAVNTNNLESDLNIILNNVNIDTDSKKIPAIYIYNKDINYTEHKVTIKTLANTKNTIRGGKLKKISLMPKENISSFIEKYPEKVQSDIEKYSNYYGIYNEADIDNLLFAKVMANDEDLYDKDPYYFYKASGAVSSDIDLYFEGEGYLEIESINNEGIETKGNLSMLGGTGDYVINSLDDSLNTTTKNSKDKNVRNDIVIDVKSLYAIVSKDADEGDAIDSNGTLTINGGKIVAISKTGADFGIDSENGTYINGGDVLATGDMYDHTNKDSKQKFMVLSFGFKVNDDTLITLLDNDDNVLFSYETDRVYTTLVYSSNKLKDGIYSLYRSGKILGVKNYGLYNEILSYEKGTQLAYTEKVIGENYEKPPVMGDENGKMMPPPDGEMMPPPDGGGMMPPPSNGQMPPDNWNMPMMPPGGMGFGVTSAKNKEFNISGITNLFSGIAMYKEES